MIYTLFEECNVENFYPFTLTHSIGEIRCGMYTNIERVQNMINSETDEIILIVRDEIKEIVVERYPDIKINPDVIPKCTLINAKLIAREFMVEMEESSINEFRDSKLYRGPQISSPIQYLWDYIKINGIIIKEDIDKLESQCSNFIHKSCIFVKREQTWIGSDVKINAGVVLDASTGPIIIGDDAVLDIGALIKGPAYIGKGTIINPGAKLRGNVTIGPCCKVGGEVENTIIHGYSNKQHDGYLGHSYIGEWVNLGANTNNSDLKNNYGKVRFQIGDKKIDTEEMFLGCFIGDYTKTGISTMINTGTYMGIGCNIFGGGFQDKFIPSFRWGVEERTDIEKFIDTIQIIKERREREVTEQEEKLIRKIYKNSKTKKL